MLAYQRLRVQADVGTKDAVKIIGAIFKKNGLNLKVKNLKDLDGPGAKKGTYFSYIGATGKVAGKSVDLTFTLEGSKVWTEFNGVDAPNSSTPGWEGYRSNTVKLLAKDAGKAAKAFRKEQEELAAKYQELVDFYEGLQGAMVEIQELIEQNKRNKKNV